MKKNSLLTSVITVLAITILSSGIFFAFSYLNDKEEMKNFKEVELLTNEFVEKVTNLGNEKDITIENFLFKDSFHGDLRIFSCNNITEYLKYNSKFKIGCHLGDKINKYFSYSNSLIISNLNELKIKDIKSIEDNQVIITFDVFINEYKASLKATDVSSDGTIEVIKTKTPIKIESITLIFKKNDNKIDGEKSFFIVGGNFNDKLRQYSSLWDMEGNILEHDNEQELFVELNINN